MPRKRSAELPWVSWLFGNAQLLSELVVPIPDWGNQMNHIGVLHSILSCFFSWFSILAVYETFFWLLCHTVFILPTTICEFGIEFLPTRLWDCKIFSSQFVYLTAMLSKKQVQNKSKKQTYFHTLSIRKLLYDCKRERKKSWDQQKEYLFALWTNGC